MNNYLFETLKYPSKKFYFITLALNNSYVQYILFTK